jgi:hypothetical protein
MGGDVEGEGAVPGVLIVEVVSTFLCTVDVILGPERKVAEDGYDL